VNARRQIRVRDRELALVGLGDLWSRELAAEGVLERAPDPARATILLSHNPDSKSVVADYAWDVMLCGHTHGGQFRVPFTNIRPFLPVIDKTMAEGLHIWRGRPINITRGVGNLHGFRFNCPPEVSVLDITV
jgi:predicted MPP superfamily phosphohydrolase